jgi:hypothetical protein
MAPAASSRDLVSAVPVRRQRAARAPRLHRARSAARSNTTHHTTTASGTREAPNASRSRLARMADAPADDDPRLEFAFQMATARITGQMAQVAELRGRVGIVLSGAAVATGFLAGQALDASEGLPLSAWVERSVRFSWWWLAPTFSYLGRGRGSIRMLRRSWMTLIGSRVAKWRITSAT